MWQFIAMRDKSILKELSTCGEWAGHLAGAALDIAILTPDPDRKFQIMFDAGQAAAFMQLAAWNRGVAFAHRAVFRLSIGRREIVRAAEERWTGVVRGCGALGSVVKNGSLRVTHFFILSLPDTKQGESYISSAR
jgi:hypothetical protein